MCVAKGGGGGVGNTENELSGMVGINRGWEVRVTFLPNSLIFKVSFFGSRNVSLFVERTSSHSVFLPLHQCNFLIIMHLHFFYDIYYL